MCRMRTQISTDQASLLRAVSRHEDFIQTDSYPFHYMYSLPSSVFKKITLDAERYLCRHLCTLLSLPLQFTVQVVCLFVSGLDAVQSFSSLFAVRVGS